MKKVKIFLADDSEYSEIVSIANGSRPDVLVQLDDELYRLSFYDIFSLTQEFNEAIAANQPYDIDNNIILVPKTSREEIVKAVLHLADNGYFKKVKPIDLAEEFEENFRMYPYLNTLDGWKQIYKFDENSISSKHKKMKKIRHIRRIQTRKRI